MKQEYISVKPDGTLDFKLLPLGWDTRKPADFSRWAELNPLIVTMWAALEMGDDPVIAATSRTIDSRYGEGVAASMTWGRRNTIRDMVNKGLPDAWAKGPILSDARYPDVIVARAVTDGQALSLILHPGGDRVEADLGLSRLVPGRSYRVVQSGAAIIADAQGRGAVKARIDGRTPIDIVPVA